MSEQTRQSTGGAVTEQHSLARLHHSEQSQIDQSIELKERIHKMNSMSEKDRTLYEIIDWCEQNETFGLETANALLSRRKMEGYDAVKVRADAYRQMADHCRSMLSYNGSMPSEDVK